MKSVKIKRRYPEIYKYSTDHIAPLLLKGKVDEIVTEVAEQVYQFLLFTPEFCRKLIEEAEANGQWETELQVDMYQPSIDEADAHQAIPHAERFNCSRINDKDEDAPNDEDDKSLGCLSYVKMPGLFAMHKEVIARHVAPLAMKLWDSGDFKMSMPRNPYVLRYDFNDFKRGTQVHWDQSALSCNVYLNDEFEGGGTYFPRWKYFSGKLPVGSALMYPGGIAHEHGGFPITKGKRYLLICDNY